MDPPSLLHCNKFHPSSGLSLTEKLSTDIISKYEQLIWAVRHGKRELINSLLDERTPVNSSTVFNDLRSALHSSVYFGDPDIVKKLLDRGASVNTYNRNIETPLILAAKMGKQTITDLLLHAKGLENCCSREKLTHLHIACMRNKVEIVKNLIDSKADVNAAVHSSSISWPGYTPLHFAVHYSCIETVKYLLSIGADITIGDFSKSTPLHLANVIRNDQVIDSILSAHKYVYSNPVNSEGISHFHISCTRNNVDVVKHFIETGVNPRDLVPQKSLNWPSYAAIDFAIYYECIDVVKLLLLCGETIKSPHCSIYRVGSVHNTGNSDLVELFFEKYKLQNASIEMEKASDIHVSCINNEIESLMKILSEMPSSLNSAIWKGNSLLHLAVKCKNVEVAQYLLSQGADYEAQNLQGKSSLHLAFDHSMREIIELILEDYKNFSENPADHDGISHLHIACAKKNVKAVERYIKLGVDLNVTVNADSAFWPGCSPLHMAVKNHSVEVVRLLLDHKACYSLLDVRNSTPFDVAIHQSKQMLKRMNSCRIMKMILNTHHTSRLDSFDDRGFSHLHLMCMESETEVESEVESVRQYILEYPSDVKKAVQRSNSPYDGYTPLHFAADNGAEKIIKLLLESGADLISKAESGKTPLYLLLYRRSSCILEILHDFLQVQKTPVEILDHSFFHLICIAGDLELIKHHLANGADPNCSVKRTTDMSNNWTPLHLVALKSYSLGHQVAKLLIDYGANPNARDIQMNTPLHHILDNSDPKFIDVLVNHGADVNALNANSETPLLSICLSVEDVLDIELSFGLMRSFLNNGADINLADWQGRTPLTIDTWDLFQDEGDEEEEDVEGYFDKEIDLLLKHVIKLKMIGFYVSEINQQAFSSLLTKHSTRLNLNQTDFENECTEELDSMKKFGIDRYTTLYDMLFKDLNGLAVATKNDALRRIINSGDLEKDFPIYGFMLPLQWRKGIIRRPLLEKSLQALDSTIGRKLPSNLKENILQLLNNDDLKSIILCAETQ
ncbi:hypothetical protein QAD02_024073 [Eretmocerus hayati]|uniref:Uncharacterized protein n=1 Tax=Eretmocerus hayati TaxID=131215 RepID=A0ACC2PYS5_9HYME|nr:hypothetical protein QAD02_024073 [Eretmocerus hayati]